MADPDSEQSDILGTVADFELMDSSGKTVTKEDLLGKVWIASFLLIPCPEGNCPQVTQTIKRLQDDLADRSNLKFVTFIVDPNYNDPELLRQYADKFKADPNRWLFLTGSKTALDNLLRSFHLPHSGTTWETHLTQHETGSG